jgi:hypothetical protein
VAALRAREAELRARAAANPVVFRRRALGAAVGVLVLVVAWQLWRNRPRPVRTAFDVAAPTATDLTLDPPTPHSLRV